MHYRLDSDDDLIPNSNPNQSNRTPSRPNPRSNAATPATNANDQYSDWSPGIGNATRYAEMQDVTNSDSVQQQGNYSYSNGDSLNGSPNPVPATGASGNQSPVSRTTTVTNNQNQQGPTLNLGGGLVLRLNSDNTGGTLVFGGGRGGRGGTTLMQLGTGGDLRNRIANGPRNSNNNVYNLRCNMTAPIMLCSLAVLGTFLMYTSYLYLLEGILDIRTKKLNHYANAVSLWNGQPISFNNLDTVGLDGSTKLSDQSKTQSQSQNFFTGGGIREEFYNKNFEISIASESDNKDINNLNKNFSPMEKLVNLIDVEQQTIRDSHHMMDAPIYKPLIYQKRIFIKPDSDWEFAVSSASFYAQNDPRIQAQKLADDSANTIGNKLRIKFRGPGSDYSSDTDTNQQLVQVMQELPMKISRIVPLARLRKSSSHNNLQIRQRSRSNQINSMILSQAQSEQSYRHNASLTNSFPVPECNSWQIPSPGSSDSGTESAQCIQYWYLKEVCFYYTHGTDGTGYQQKNGDDTNTIKLWDNNFDGPLPGLEGLIDVSQQPIYLFKQSSEIGSEQLNNNRTVVKDSESSHSGESISIQSQSRTYGNYNNLYSDEYETLLQSSYHKACGAPIYSRTPILIKGGKRIVRTVNNFKQEPRRKLQVQPSTYQFQSNSQSNNNNQPTQSFGSMQTIDNGQNYYDLNYRQKLKEQQLESNKLKIPGSSVRQESPIFTSNKNYANNGDFHREIIVTIRSVHDPFAFASELTTHEYVQYQTSKIGNTRQQQIQQTSSSQSSDSSDSNSHILTEQTVKKTELTVEHYLDFGPLSTSSYFVAFSLFGTAIFVLLIPLMHCVTWLNACCQQVSFSTVSVRGSSETTMGFENLAFNNRRNLNLNNNDFSIAMQLLGQQAGGTQNQNHRRSPRRGAARDEERELLDTREFMILEG